MAVCSSLPCPADIVDYLSYNPATGAFIWIKNSPFQKMVGLAAGRFDGKRYIRIQFRGRSYQAHRLAWFFATGVWPHDLVDHINGDGLDNRFANLRIVDAAQNSQNSARNAGKRLPKGVYVESSSGLFRASIRNRGAYFSLGRFVTADAAADAYARAARRLHGEFARID